MNNGNTIEQQQQQNGPDEVPPPELSQQDQQNSQENDINNNIKNNNSDNDSSTSDYPLKTDDENENNTKPDENDVDVDDDDDIHLSDDGDDDDYILGNNTSDIDDINNDIDNINDNNMNNAADAAPSLDSVSCRTNMSNDEIQKQEETRIETLRNLPFKKASTAEEKRQLVLLLAIRNLVEQFMKDQSLLTKPFDQLATEISDQLVAASILGSSKTALSEVRRILLEELEESFDLSKVANFASPKCIYGRGRVQYYTYATRLFINQRDSDSVGALVHAKDCLAVQYMYVATKGESVQNDQDCSSSSKLVEHCVNPWRGAITGAFYDWSTNNNNIDDNSNNNDEQVDNNNNNNKDAAENDENENGSKKSSSISLLQLVPVHLRDVFGMNRILPNDDDSTTADLLSSLSERGVPQSNLHTALTHYYYFLQLAVDPTTVFPQQYIPTERAVSPQEIAKTIAEYKNSIKDQGPLIAPDLSSLMSGNSLTWEKFVNNVLPDEIFNSDNVPNAALSEDEFLKAVAVRLGCIPRESKAILIKLLDSEDGDDSGDNNNNNNNNNNNSPLLLKLVPTEAANPRDQFKIRYVLRSRFNLRNFSSRSDTMSKRFAGVNLCMFLYRILGVNSCLSKKDILRCLDAFGYNIDNRLHDFLESCEKKIAILYFGRDLDSDSKCFRSGTVAASDPNENEHNAALLVCTTLHARYNYHQKQQQQKQTSDQKKKSSSFIQCLPWRSRAVTEMLMSKWFRTSSSSSKNNNNNNNNDPSTTTTTNLLRVGGGDSINNSNNNSRVLHHLVKFTPPSVAPIIASLSPYLIRFYNLLLEIIPVGGMEREEIFSQLPRKGWRGSQIEEECLGPLVSKGVLIRFTRDHRGAASSSSSSSHHRQQHQRENNSRIVWYALARDKSVPSIPVFDENRDCTPVQQQQDSAAGRSSLLVSSPPRISSSSSLNLNLKSATRMYLENLKSLLPPDGLERSGIFAVMNHKHGWSDVKMQEEFLNELEAKGVISQHRPYPDIPSIVKIYLLILMPNQQQQQQQQQPNSNNNNNHQGQIVDDHEETIRSSGGAKVVDDLLSISQRLGKLLDSSPMVKNGPGGDLKQKERSVLFAVLRKLTDYFGLERILDRGQCLPKEELLHDVATKGRKPIKDDNERNKIYNWLVQHDFIKERFSNSRREHVIELHRNFRESMDSKWIIKTSFQNEKEAGVRRSREGDELLGAVVSVEQLQHHHHQQIHPTLPSIIPTSSLSADRIITKQDVSDETGNNNDQFSYSSLLDAHFSQMIRSSTNKTAAGLNRAEMLVLVNFMKFACVGERGGNSSVSSLKADRGAFFDWLVHQDRRIFSSRRDVEPICDYLLSRSILEETQQSRKKSTLMLHPDFVRTLERKIRRIPPLSSSEAPPPLLHHHAQNSSPRNTATPHHNNHNHRIFSSASNPISFPPPLVITNGGVFWRYSILPKLMIVPPPFIVVPRSK